MKHIFTNISDMLKRLWFLCIALISLEAVPAIEIREEFIFSYPPFDACYAPTLTETDSGSILCAWTGVLGEDTAIWLSTLSQGAAWSAPKLIASEESGPCWYPALFTMPSKDVWLYYKVGGDSERWSSALRLSYDNGDHWSGALELDGNSAVQSFPLLYPNGKPFVFSGTWRLWSWWDHNEAVVSADSEPLPFAQPVPFFGKDKTTIKVLISCYHTGRRSLNVVESKNQGRTWSDMRKLSLSSSNTPIDITNLADGRVLLIYNRSEKEKDRYPLNIALSKDYGETWTTIATLESAPGEYTDPCVIQTADEKIHIVYTWNRTQIKHVVLDPKLL